MLASIRHRLLLFPCRAAAVSSSSSIPTSKSHSPHSTNLTNPNDASATNPTVSYLVGTCGLSPDTAASAARKTRLKSTTNADAVLALLKHYGLSDAHISKMARKSTKFLNCDPDQTIKPKIDFFLRAGFSGPALAKLLTGDPLVFEHSLQRHLVPCVDFLRNILGTKESLVSTFSSYPRALRPNLEKVMQPALQTLRGLRVSEDKIARLVELRPGILMMTSERIKEVVEAVKAAGLQPTDQKFIYVFWVVSTMKRSSWESKVALFRSHGFSEEQVFSALICSPTCMTISEKTARKKLEFFINKLKLSLADISKNSVLLTHSLEKTIIPRCAVLIVLMREGKIAGGVKLSTALRMNSKDFLKRFVSKYQPDVPGVVRAYNGEIEFNGFAQQLAGRAFRSGHRSSGAQHHTQ